MRPRPAECRVLSAVRLQQSRRPAPLNTGGDSDFLGIGLGPARYRGQVLDQGRKHQQAGGKRSRSATPPPGRPTTSASAPKRRPERSPPPPQAPTGRPSLPHADPRPGYLSDHPRLTHRGGSCGGRHPCRRRRSLRWAAQQMLPPPPRSPTSPPVSRSGSRWATGNPSTPPGGARSLCLVGARHDRGRRQPRGRPLRCRTGDRAAPGIRGHDVAGGIGVHETCAHVVVRGDRARHRRGDRLR